MRSILVVFVALASGLAGCLPVPSLYPLVERDGIDVPGLPGVWHDSSDTLVFVRDSLGAYTMRGLNPETSDARWRARFIRLDGRLFGDLCVVPATLPGGDMSPFLQPMHVLVRVDLAGDSLRLDPLDDDWLDKAIRHGRLRARVERPEGSLVLTEPTPGLKRMLRKIAKEKDAFSSAMTMSRAR